MKTFREKEKMLATGMFSFSRFVFKSVFFKVVKTYDYVLEGEGMEDIIGKGKTACYLHFLLFPKCLQ